jgi:hypothetical protein
VGIAMREMYICVYMYICIYTLTQYWVNRPLKFYWLMD